MTVKLKEKEIAIELRKQGHSYSEILKKVPVAKSTLSLWLRSVGLAERQKQRLTEKKRKGQLKGAQVKRKQRILLAKKIKDEAIKEIGKISKRELWLIGTALYWAEGTKQKENTPSQKVRFSNSDPRMIKFFLKWLTETCSVPLEELGFEIYIHETANIEEAKRFWSNILNLPLSKFQKVRLKKHKIQTNRKNINKDYHGLLAISVKRSTNLNRKITGWIEGIYKNCGVV
jgi:transposase